MKAKDFLAKTSSIDDVMDCIEDMEARMQAIPDQVIKPLKAEIRAAADHVPGLFTAMEELKAEVCKPIEFPDPAPEKPKFWTFTVHRGRNGLIETITAEAIRLE